MTPSGTAAISLSVVVNVMDTGMCLLNSSSTVPLRKAKRTAGSEQNSRDDKTNDNGDDDICHFSLWNRCCRRLGSFGVFGEASRDAHDLAATLADRNAEPPDAPRPRALSPTL